MADRKMPLTGGCQCGAVRYELKATPLPPIICHCKECQKQTASAFGMTLPVLRRDLKLLSGDHKDWRRLADGGRQLACYFCPPMRNQALSQLLDRPGVLALEAGHPG